MRKQLIVAMMCLIPIMADSHMGKEVHCSKNAFHVPCYDENLGKVIYQQENKTPPPESHNHHDLFRWFDDGVLVCSNIYTDNIVARELLVEPYPNWKYGIPEKWKTDNLSMALKELGNFYFCRYSFYEE